MTTQAQTQGGGFPIRLVIAIVAIVLLLILVFQNSQTVSLDIFFWTVESRLIWLLLAVGALGFLAGLLLPRFRESR